jgi:hypothetical protein
MGDEIRKRGGDPDDVATAWQYLAIKYPSADRMAAARSPVENKGFTSREAWLSAAADILATDFRGAGYQIPRMRFAIAFPSTGRFGKRVGECWSDSASADATHEIFIRADQHDPVDVLSIQTTRLLKALCGCGYTVRIVIGMPKMSRGPGKSMAAWVHHRLQLALRP